MKSAHNITTDIYQPPVSFQFEVHFQEIGKVPVADSWFQEVSGLNVNVETEEYREAGSRYTRHLPVRTSFGTLSLKRGFFKDSALIEWCRKAVDDFEFKPANLTILLMNEKKEALATWNVFNAIPIKWNVSGFNAERTDLVIETLELKYEYFQMK